jgi:anhydro-N-acetylmuramic acid kinase
MTIIERLIDAGLSEAEARAKSATFQSLERHLPDARGLWVCGGGALNRHLLARLAALLPQVSVQTTDALGLPPLQVEAVAFAWLAREFVERRAGNRPDVTGAKNARTGLPSISLKSTRCKSKRPRLGAFRL